MYTSEPQQHLYLPSSAGLTVLSLHQVHWGRVMQSLQTVYCSQSCAITAAAWEEEGTIVQVKTNFEVLSPGEKVFHIYFILAIYVCTQITSCELHSVMIP